jgi:NhaP-type Na+/H+ or K+/H+ antiporter
MHILAHISGPGAQAIETAFTMALIGAVIIGLFLAWLLIWFISRIVRSSRQRSDESERNDKMTNDP